MNDYRMYSDNGLNKKLYEIQSSYGGTYITVFWVVQTDTAGSFKMSEPAY
jgi:hypothetical protein